MERENSHRGSDSSPQTKRSSSNTWRVKCFHIHCHLQSSQRSAFLVLIHGIRQVCHVSIKFVVLDDPISHGLHFAWWTGDANQDRYFFSNTGAKDIRNVNRISGATCGGHWRTIGSNEQIICRKKLPLVGIKRTMAFYNGSCRTEWIMHVYCITTSETRNSNIQHKKNPKVNFMSP